jgi:uncharacterized repeat protein (TIGR03803 family)
MNHPRRHPSWILGIRGRAADAALALAIMLVAAVVATGSAQAQTYTESVLHSFTGPPDGASPVAGLVRDAQGNLYGTTFVGGDPACGAGCGTVFKVDTTGNETVLYSFTFAGEDGYDPGGLVRDAQGNLYGTTSAGGASGKGTVFKVDTTGKETLLYSFSWAGGYGADGAYPLGLVQDAQGNLYGTTTSGGDLACDGPYGCGTVFKLDTTGKETVLYSFTGGRDGDGEWPAAEPLLDAQGNLYGTTDGGGAYGFFGTVFKVDTTGKETVLYSFTPTGGDGSDPHAGLVQDAQGNLYGTTLIGGDLACNAPSGCGTVFKVDTTGKETVLYSFTGTGGDGASPVAGLVRDAQGNLYGTTVYGGDLACNAPSGCGTVFKVDTTGKETVLYSFTGTGGDGASPEAGLVRDAQGNLYGTTVGGGDLLPAACPTRIVYAAPGCGTVFELQMAANSTLTVSTSGNGTVTSTDGFISCPGTCSHSYPPNTQVTLNATPGQGWVFGGWNGACLGTGSCTVTMTQPLSVDAIFSQAQQFVAATPCRLIDTRLTGGPIPGGTYRSFPIPQEGGCNIPTTAAAYSLNVSVVPQGPLGYLTIWPTDEVRPVVATLNSLDGRIKADAAIVPAGTSGAVSVYVTNTSNVVLDINGYFEPVSGSTLAFYPLTPCRIADTRNNTFPPGLGPPFLPGHTERDFPILAATSCNIPSSGVAAYSLNFSVVPHGGLGYMTVWPTGQTRPLVSTLNDVPGTIIANAAIVPAGTSGDVSVYPSNDTDVIIDINGYFAPAGPGGLSLYPAAPCRVIDTRHVGNGQPFSGTLTPPVDVVHSPCEPPVTALAYVFNATVVPTGALGYLTLWPDGDPKPLVSTLNALDGSITNNMAIVPSSNGKVDAFAAGITQLILDISSYFAP